MLIQIRAGLATLFRTLPGWLFRTLPAWFRTNYLWMLLLIPAALIITVYQLADANFMGMNKSKDFKPLMEILHPSLLATGVSIALFGWLLTRNTSLAFLGVLCAFFLAREFGGQGTSFIPIIGLLILFIYGNTNQLKLKTLLHSRLACSCLATGFISYAVTQLLDRGAIKHLGKLILQDPLWKLNYSSQMEESLEALGGGFLLLTVLVVLLLAMNHSERQRIKPLSFTE